MRQEKGWNGNEAFISKLFHEGNTTMSLWKRDLEQQNSVSFLSWSLRLKRATCENSGPVEPGPLQISDFRPIRARPRSGRRRHTGEFLRPVAIATEHCGVSVNVCVLRESSLLPVMFYFLPLSLTHLHPASLLSDSRSKSITESKTRFLVRYVWLNAQETSEREFTWLKHTARFTGSCPNQADQIQTQSGSSREWNLEGILWLFYVRLLG